MGCIFKFNVKYRDALGHIVELIEVANSREEILNRYRGRIALSIRVIPW